MSETNRREYKRELTPELDIEKEVVAFLTIRRAATSISVLIRMDQLWALVMLMIVCLG